MSPDRLSTNSLDEAQFFANLLYLRQQVEDQVRGALRPAGSVRVLIAAKTQSAADTWRAANTWAQVGAHLGGQVNETVIIGHNRVQELIRMQAAWPAGGPSIEWHLIGSLQRNKINATLRSGALIQTVDSLELAQGISSRLALQRLTQPVPYRVFLQVNAAQEATKSGCNPREARQIGTGIQAIPGIELGGIMGIGAHSNELGKVEESLAALRAIRDDLAADLGRELELSMGMSQDYPCAITQGATIIRLGRAFFGTRAPREPK